MTSILTSTVIFIILTPLTMHGMSFRSRDCDIPCHYGFAEMNRFEQCICHCFHHFTGNKCDEAFVKRCCTRDDCVVEEQCPPNFYCETDSKMCLTDPQRCGNAYGWCVPLPRAEIF
ncbi:hypothetical protein Tcan_16543 [Toxocara canis]|uniref:Uncharacterized protein n=1 Tax=Toxocara canis TaxID=6265 RepID=A0A0B2VGS2_TOXCA|nr:hypothetical protein Tcan_16543 [Toxocara canis]